MGRRDKLGRVRYGSVRGPYRQDSVKMRIEALFLDNIGKVLSREQVMEAAKDPVTGKEPENWHQRLSELRTDDGYSILSWRNRGALKVQEYLMPDSRKRPGAGKRVRPAAPTWAAVLKRAGYRCQWSEGGQKCGLKEGASDPVGGGTVKLTPDHKRPHSVNPRADPEDAAQWRALCGRHQVMKKNYWDNLTGKVNAYAVVQAAPEAQKREIFLFLLRYFGYNMGRSGSVIRTEQAHAPRRKPS